MTDIIDYDSRTDEHQAYVVQISSATD